MSVIVIVLVVLIVVGLALAFFGPRDNRLLLVALAVSMLWLLVGTTHVVVR